MSYHYICVPSVLMREQPSHEARVVSEALYAEPIVLKQVHQEWTQIITPDLYEGWIPSVAIISSAQPYPGSGLVLHTRHKAVHVYNVKDTEWGAIKTLPFGIPLVILDESDPRWYKVQLLERGEAYVHKGDMDISPRYTHQSDLIAFGKQFFGLPYTWGGRSSFGFDCSGFVQMLYRHLGVNLPRDSCCQIKDSRFRDMPVEDLQAGDLVFFGKSPDQIRHVGMAVGDGSFLHTSPLEHLPFLRQSRLSDPTWRADPNSPLPYRLGRSLNDRE